METMIFGYIAVILLGLIMGSFAGASVWRIRARQLMQDKKAGEPIDKAEFKKLNPLTKSKITDDRSRCLHCGHELQMKDLIPLFSWLSTGGKCRYCKKPIGRFEPLIELGTAAAFILTYTAWLNAYDASTTGLLLLVGGLIVIVMLAILFAYDAKWFLLPDSIVFPLTGMGTIYAVYTVVVSPDPFAAILTTLGSVAILSGIYLAMWVLSKGMLVGFGDVKLGLALGLLLADWRLAFMALFLANFIGTLLVLPGLIRKKLDRKTQVPFGPLFILGFAIAALYGGFLLSQFEVFSLWLLDVTLMV